MKIGIFGIGGVGGVLGAALAKKYDDIYFIARGKALEKIKRDGLEIRSEILGDFTVHPASVTDTPSELGKLDVIFICCKGYDLEDACKKLSLSVSSDTIIIPLQNGINVAKQIKPMLPECVIAGGTVTLLSHIESPGCIVNDDTTFRLIIGMEDSSQNDKLKKIASMINDAGLKTFISDNIAVDVWVKFLWMPGFSTLLFYYGGTAEKILSAPDLDDAINAVIKEVYTVASACNIELPKDAGEKFTKKLLSLQPGAMTSLYRDVINGNEKERTELDHLLKNFIKLGEDLNIPTPYFSKAYENACLLLEENKRKR